MRKGRGLMWRAPESAHGERLETIGWPSALVAVLPCFGACIRQISLETTMKGRIRGRLTVALGVAVLAVISPSAAAQKPQRTRSIQVKPDNRFGAVEVELQLETVRRVDGAAAGVRTGDPVQVGDNVVLCFRSSADGYVTVWSQDAEGDVPVRIYPNEYAAETADERAAAVVAGEETCIGDDDGFRLEVGRPLGNASVYLHYTPREELQFDDTAFPQIRATRAPDPRPYASSYVRYRVVDR